MEIDGYYYCKKLEAVGGKRTSAEKKRFNYLEERESAGDEGGKREGVCETARTARGTE